MTMSASKTLIRYLGPSEVYFWLSNQNSWKHFVVAAQITDCRQLMDEQKPAVRENPGCSDIHGI